METTTIRVPEVHCDHCVTSIEGALQPMDGVSNADVDLDTTTVTVTWDPSASTLDQVVAAIEEQGYLVERPAV